MLATAVASIGAAGIAEALMTRIGPKIVLPAGLAAMAIRLVWFAQISVTDRRVRDLLGPLILIGLGTGFSFVPISIIALSGVPERLVRARLRAHERRSKVGGAVGPRGRCDHLHDAFRARAAAAARRRSPARGSRCRRRWSAGSRSRTGSRSHRLRRLRTRNRASARVRVVEEELPAESARRLAVLHQPLGDERVLDRSGPATPGRWGLRTVPAAPEGPGLRARDDAELPHRPEIVTIDPAFGERARPRRGTQTVAVISTVLPVGGNAEELTLVGSA